MQYETVFDLAEYGYRDGYWFLIGGIVVALAIGGILWQKRRGRRSILAWFLFVMGLVAGLGGGGVPLWDHHRLVEHLRAGRCLVVEGEVGSHSVERVKSKNVRSGGYNTSTWEAFYVADVAFGFYRGRTPVGFLNGGKTPIDLHDGMRIRIHYFEDVPGQFDHRRIVRLEIARGGQA